ncbi:MAG: FMN-binding negative transcriptional regulator [Cyclobacteriaceae bacterium]|nr:FMN-binding negative transcriptional regulator [Cyclobacteriaceae bacterium SS2]
MYNPSFNKVTDLQEIYRFIQRYSFGLIINTIDQTPLATHLPFHIKMEDGSIKIFGHFARANKQWQSLNSGKSLVVFSEPHAYISPSHYDQVKNVPTWNYCAVQCYGKATIIEDEDQCMEMLRDLIAVNDQTYLSQWDTAIDIEYKQKMLKGTVMFRIDVDEIHAKYKLSQNRSHSEQVRVSEFLADQPDSNAREIGLMMKKNLDNVGAD